MAKKTKKTAKKKTAKRAALKRPAAKKTVAKKKTSKPAARKAAPKGHVSVAPGITANDAAASIAWYCDVLGFTIIERWEHEGQFRGAQIGSGAVVLNVGQDDWKLGRDRVKGLGTRFYILTAQDIDKYAAEIKARGGNLDQEPTDGWGLRAFSISDPDGFKITFMNGRG